MDRLAAGWPWGSCGGSTACACGGQPATRLEVARSPRDFLAIRDGRSGSTSSRTSPFKVFGAGHVLQPNVARDVTELVFHVYPRHRVEEADRPHGGQDPGSSPPQPRRGDGRRGATPESASPRCKCWRQNHPCHVRPQERHGHDGPACRRPVEPPWVKVTVGYRLPGGPARTSGGRWGHHLKE